MRVPTIAAALLATTTVCSAQTSQPRGPRAEPRGRIVRPAETPELRRTERYTAPRGSGIITATTPNASGNLGGPSAGGGAGSP